MKCTHVHDNLLCREDMLRMYTFQHTYKEHERNLWISKMYQQWRHLTSDFEVVWRPLQRTLFVEKNIALANLLCNPERLQMPTDMQHRLPRLSRRLFGAVGDSKSVLNLKRWRKNPSIFSQPKIIWFADSSRHRSRNNSSCLVKLRKNAIL